MGYQHEDRSPIYLGGNRHEIRGFARTWSGFQLAQGHTLPGIAWYEADVPFPAAPFHPHGEGLDRGAPLLPGATRTINEVKAELGDGGNDPVDGSDCEGLFTYNITNTPWTFASLDPNLRAPA